MVVKKGVDKEIIDKVVVKKGVDKEIIDKVVVDKEVLDNEG